MTGQIQQRMDAEARTVIFGDLQCMCDQCACTEPTVDEQTGDEVCDSCKVGLHRHPDSGEDC